MKSCFLKVGLNELEWCLNNISWYQFLLRLFYFINDNLWEFMRFHIYFSVLNNTKMIFFGIQWCLHENFLVLNYALTRFFLLKQYSNDIKLLKHCLESFCSSNPYNLCTEQRKSTWFNTESVQTNFFFRFEIWDSRFFQSRPCLVQMYA